MVNVGTSMESLSLGLFRIQVSAQNLFPSCRLPSLYAASGMGQVLERAFEHILSFDFKCWVSLLFYILDPPPPDESPNITSVSHNSVKVKFSGFDASHGPIKAYAIILTTGEGKEGPTWVNLCDKTILVTFLLF